MLADVLTGVTPSIPLAADHIASVPSWEMGGNDEFGTCGPTSVANYYRMLSFLLAGKMHAISLEEVYDLYRRSGNPNFDPTKSYDDPTQDDNGVYMDAMLNAAIKGGIGKNEAGQVIKPMAYAKIAPGDMDTLDKAIAIFGGVLLGLNLQVAQQRQTTWEYVAGSGVWGGHAVLSAAYRDPDGTASDRISDITWAERVDATRSFVAHQEDEAWVVIFAEHFGSKRFLEGVDVSALASAYQDLTGRTFPVSPAPVPAPPVGPAPAVARPVDTALRAALTRDKYRPLYVKNAQAAWEKETF